MEFIKKETDPEFEKIARETWNEWQEIKDRAFPADNTAFQMYVINQLAGIFWTLEKLMVTLKNR